MTTQIYEDYWKITNAYTDYNGEKFIGSLKSCLEFIDNNLSVEYSTDKYVQLHNKIATDNNIAEPSARKVINQFIKFGFIKSFLVGYPDESKNYAEALTDRKRASLLSKIVYSYSSFNRSTTEETNEHQLNFLIKTLIENGKINKEEIVALMLVNIRTIDKGFLNREELDYYYNRANEIGFIERKYNQIDHLTNLLKKLDGLVFREEYFYFKEDAKRIFGKDSDVSATRKRDPYLHNIYKNQLKEEVEEKRNLVICMVERLEYPSLVASHIKPFIVSDENEAYDPHNGLLLSRNIDVLFDLGYISFSNDGNIIYGTRLSSGMRNHLNNYTLDNIFLNEKRFEYLDYHRQNILK